MLKKEKFEKNLINLDWEKFLQFSEGQKSSINFQEARLIPLLKTGDEHIAIGFYID